MVGTAAAERPAAAASGDDQQPLSSYVVPFSEPLVLPTDPLYKNVLKLVRKGA